MGPEQGRGGAGGGVDPGLGQCRIDVGAQAALLRGASLLPGGVLAVAGDFRRGDVVELQSVEGAVLARGQAQYNAVESARIAGHHSREIEAILGHQNGQNGHQQQNGLVTISTAG